MEFQAATQCFPLVDLVDFCKAKNRMAYPALVLLSDGCIAKQWLAEVHGLVYLSPLWSATVLTGVIMPLLQPHKQESL